MNAQAATLLEFPAEMPAPQTATAVETLTAGMRRGDEAAWSSFHIAYHFALMRYALGIAPGIDASEVCQQAYVRVSRHVKIFRDDADFRRWLCCIVRCVVADLRRESKRRSLLQERFALWREQRRTPPGPLDVPDVSAQVRDLLDRLPPADAELLRRKYYEGWTTAELASAASCSSKAVECRLARLREHLKKKLIEGGSDV